MKIFHIYIILTTFMLHRNLGHMGTWGTVINGHWVGAHRWMDFNEENNGMYSNTY